MHVDPDLEDLHHPQLQVFARRAAWLATLEKTVSDLEQHTPIAALLDRQVSDESTCLVVARDIVDDTRDELNIALSVQVRQWLADDPEHASLLRLLVVLPWQTANGPLRNDAPPWARILSAYAALPPVVLPEDDEG